MNYCFWILFSIYFSSFLSFSEQRGLSDGLTGDHSLEDSEVSRAELDEVHLVTVIAVQIADASSVEDSPTPVSSPKHGSGLNRKRTNKWIKNRRGYWRHHGSKRRPLKGKKEFQKTHRHSVAPLQYFNRSSHTDDLNNAIDHMLANFCLHLNEENSTMTLKLNYFQKRQNMSPWTFIVLNETDAVNEVSNLDEVTRSKRSSEVEILESSDLETVDEEIDEADDQGAVTDDERNPSSSQDQTTPLTESNNEEGKDSDDDDNDEEDEDEEIHGNGSPTNTSEPGAYTSSLRIQRIKDPLPIMVANGTVEYNLQLLNEEEAEVSKDETEEHNDDKREPKKFGKGRSHSRRYSRKLIAKVEGMGMIERISDAMIGVRENSSAIVIDTQLRIGPIQFTVEESSKRAEVIHHSRVSSPPLIARLRLTVLNGNLVSVRFKPKKIQRDEVFVTLRLKENGKLPVTSDLTKVVNFLSEEMSRAWNSGYLLRRLKRQFKKSYITKTESKKVLTNLNLAQNVVQISALSLVNNDQPTTAIPTVNEV